MSTKSKDYLFRKGSEEFYRRPDAQNKEKLGIKRTGVFGFETYLTYLGSLRETDEEIKKMPFLAPETQALIKRQNKSWRDFYELEDEMFKEPTFIENAIDIVKAGATRRVPVRAVQAVKNDQARQEAEVKVQGRRCARIRGHGRMGMPRTTVPSEKSPG